MSSTTSLVSGDNHGSRFPYAGMPLSNVLLSFEEGKVFWRTSSAVTRGWGYLKQEGGSDNDKPAKKKIGT